MLKKIIMMSLGFLPLTTWSADFEFSLGAGFQYSGLGTQFAIKSETSKYFVSLGLPGVSVGMQFTFTDDENHSIGFSVGKMYGLFDADTHYGFLTYNYHLDGFKNNGWVFGTGLGYTVQGEYSPLFSGDIEEKDKGIGVTFDIGYKF